MSIRSIAQLKQWFRRGEYPTQEQFADWLESYYHKEDDRIPTDAIDNLPGVIRGMFAESLNVSIEGRVDAPVYNFMKENFDLVAVMASSCVPVTVLITDDRKDNSFDLSGLWPAKWNSALRQIEIPDPTVARGFYIDGNTPSSRGCVTHNTRRYIDLGKCMDDSLSCRFNAEAGYYEMGGLVDLTEVNMESAANHVWYSPAKDGLNLGSSQYGDEHFRVNFPFQTHSGRLSDAIPGIALMECGLEILNLIPRTSRGAMSTIAIRVKAVANGLLDYSSIRKVYGIIDVSAVKNRIYIGASTDEVEINIKGLSMDFLCYDANISRATLIYILEKRANAVDNPIKIFLTDYSYRWASDDDDILALLPASGSYGAVTLDCL